MIKYFVLILKFSIIIPSLIFGQLQDSKENDWILLNKCEGLDEVFKSQEIVPKIISPREVDFNNDITEIIESESKPRKYTGELVIWLILQKEGDFCIGRIFQEKNYKRQLGLKPIFERVNRIEIEFEPGKQRNEDRNCEMQIICTLKKGKITNIEIRNSKFLQ